VGPAEVHICWVFCGFCREWDRRLVRQWRRECPSP
jgi:hypothetical protein